MNILDPKIDTLIRAVLLRMDQEGKLGVAAAVIGIAGGEDELRKIMKSTGELNLMDRGMIAMHLTIGESQ